jgi:PAS domain S-box-containing protein
MRCRHFADRLTRGLAIVLAVVMLPLFSAHSAQTEPPSGDNTLHRKNLLKTIIVDNYYPYTFMNPDGLPDGLSVDLIRAVAKSMGLQVEIAMATWDDARRALAAGDIDLLPMMAYSEQRAKDFDFSAPHTTAHDAIFVQKGDTRIQSMDDLWGKNVIVMGKDAAHDFLLSTGISNAGNLVLTDSLPEALRQLTLGKGDAALMPKLAGLLLLNNLGLSNLEALPVVVEGYERAFSIAVKKGDKTLLDHLSEGLSIVAATDEYAKIHRKWFGLVEPAAMPFPAVMKYVLFAASFIVLIAIVIGLWSLSLRKQVALRTRSLAQEVEERKQAEEALRQSDERLAESNQLLAGVLEHTHMMAVFLDPHFNFIWVNRAYANTCGHAPSFFPGKNHFELYPHEENQAIFKRVVDTGEPFFVAAKPFEFPDQPERGVTYWDWSLIPLTDAGGKVSGLVFTLAEVTERIRTMDALRDSEERHRTILQTAMDGFCLVDMQGRIIEVNAAYCRMSGYSEQELMSMRIPDLEVSETANDTAAHIQEVLAQGEDRFESRHRRKDGSIFDVEVSVQYRPSDGGRCVAFLRDITEDKQTKVQLREREEKFRNLFNNSEVGMFRTRLDGLKTLDVNDKFLEIFGRAREEMLGTPSVNYWADPLERQELVRRLEAEGRVTNFECKMLNKRGETRQCLTSLRTYRERGILEGSIIDITDRKLAEKVLQESEARFRVLVDSAPDAIYVQRAGRFVYLNLAACRLFGASRPEDLLGKDFMEWIAPEYHDKIRERIRLQRETGKPAAPMEQAYLRLDGSQVPVETTAVPIRYQGEDAHLVFVRDITARKQESGYREMRRQILQILNEPGDLQDSIQRVLAVLKTRTGFDAVGIRLQDGDDFPYFAQQGFSNNFLLTENTLIERATDGGLCRDKDGNLHLECTCGLVISGKTDPAHPLFTPGGSFWTNDSFPLLDIPPDEDPRLNPRNQCIHQGYASVALVPIRNTDRIVGLIQLNDRRKGRFTLAAVETLEGIASHIGAALIRKRAEEALRDSEERHRKIIESSNDAFLLRSKEIIIYANPAALKLFRANHPGDLIGKPYLDLVHPDDRALSAERLKKSIDENWVVPPREHRILALDGQVVHVESTGVSVKYRGENQHLGVFRDITERKRAEEEKAKLEAQLQQTQKMEAIGTLAGGIAHDFNNILSVIIGHAEVLNFEGDIGTSTRNSLNQILAASQRAKQLVRQILAFSRHGKQEKILINLKPIVKESLEFLRASLPTLIELRHYLEPDAGTIMADPTQMQQVLMNLCVNAAHAMEKDGGVLQIKLANAALTEEDTRFDPEVEPGDFVKLTVSDTGHGMEPSVLQRIFDPYFTTKERGKGTGLGLAVVHGIVKSHGGMIKVDSEVGKGATFTIFLPRAKGFEKIADTPLQPLARGTEKILFVDDESALADLGQQLLGELGYQVEARSSPIEALEAFRVSPQKFDLVITDLAMPQMTGLNLSRKIMEIRPGMPIILCTGFSEQANEQAASAMGICAFLLKPLVVRDIAAAVRKVLDSKNT